MFGIYTELSKMTTIYDTMEEALEVAERSLPRTMSWEIRDEETGEVVADHIISDED